MPGGVRGRQDQSCLLLDFTPHTDLLQVSIGILALLLSKVRERNNVMTERNIFMRGRRSRVLLGDSVEALNLLGDIKKKLSSAENLDHGERQYLIWGLNRLTDGEDDPFGLDSDMSKEYLWFFTGPERELEFMRAVARAIAEAHESGKKLGVDEAILQVQLDLQEIGFNQAHGTLRNLYFSFQRKWRRAEKIFNALQQHNKGQPDEAIFDLVRSELIERGEKTTPVELQETWEQYGQFVIDSLADISQPQ